MKYIPIIAILLINSICFAGPECDRVYNETNKIAGCLDPCWKKDIENLKNWKPPPPLGVDNYPPDYFTIKPYTLPANSYINSGNWVYGIMPRELAGD